MTNDPTDWHQALSGVSGQLVRGEQRVTTHELLTVHLGVPVTDRACRRLRRVMCGLGWRGPRLMRWGTKTLKGYWRHPTVGLPAVVGVEPVAEVPMAERETLAPQLEAVTRLALEKMTQILKIPTDRGDGNLLRAQTAAAGVAVNAQLRADETRLKQVHHGALAVYLNRYLNVPPARLPPSDEPALPPVELRRAFLDACDRQQQVAEAARLAASHLAAGRPPADFIAILSHAVLREDAGFHMVQNLQATVRQCLAWHGAPEIAPILIAAARYLAAHSPTSRARYQTAQVACRLMRGGEVHEDTSEAAI
jgi:hypothetical protein